MPSFELACILIRLRESEVASKLNLKKQKKSVFIIKNTMQIINVISAIVATASLLFSKYLHLKILEAFQILFPVMYFRASDRRTGIKKELSAQHAMMS